MENPEIITRSVCEELGKLMFLDNKGRLYSPLEITSFGDEYFLFVTFLTKRENGYIPLGESKNNRCLEYHNGLRLVV